MRGTGSLPLKNDDRPIEEQIEAYVNAFRGALLRYVNDDALPVTVEFTVVPKS
jgi:hypothetical protein